MELRLRPFRYEDMESLMALWQEAAPLDAPLQPEFERKTLLDPNHRPGHLLVAEAADDEGPRGLLGFVSVIIPRRHYGDEPPPKGRAHIQAIAVRPGRGHASVTNALLAAAENLASAEGCHELRVFAYPSNYYVPGVDLDRSLAMLVALMARGYHVYSDALAADISLTRWELDPTITEVEEALKQEHGVITRRCGPADVLPLLDFLRKEMPGPWLDDARRNLVAATLGQFDLGAFRVAVLVETGEVVGYCVHEGEHFGPFGVKPGMEGRGIGTVLLARTLERMRAAHLHCAYVIWTGQKALDGVYGRMGFKLTRRFALLKRELTPAPKVKAKAKGKANQK
jgi:ribosomal protein S18 acetylase RimI-like enzyme